MTAAVRPLLLDALRALVRRLQDGDNPADVVQELYALTFFQPAADCQRINSMSRYLANLDGTGLDAEWQLFTGGPGASWGDLGAVVYSRSAADPRRDGAMRPVMRLDHLEPEQIDAFGRALVWVAADLAARRQAEAEGEW